MPVPVTTARRLAFGAYEADLHSGELTKDGKRVRLQAQPFQLLVMLLERPGQLVTREEICQKLWSTDTFVDFDHSLGTAINKIREVLNDSVAEPRFVETIPRRGYRFNRGCYFCRSRSGPGATSCRAGGGNPQKSIFLLCCRGLCRCRTSCRRIRCLEFSITGGNGGSTNWLHNRP